MVAVDLEHSESLVSADRSGLSAETVTLNEMAVGEPLSTEALRSPFVWKIFLKT